MNDGVVYVLDDDPDLGASVARLLRRHGYTAEPFLDPEQLLAAYPFQAADCVLSDVMMPRMSGFQFAAALAEIDSSVGLVFMTAYATTENAVQALRQHGGRDYLTKPLQEQKLLDAIADAVAWSRDNRAMAA